MSAIGRAAPSVGIGGIRRRRCAGSDHRHRHRDRRRVAIAGERRSPSAAHQRVIFAAPAAARPGSGRSPRPRAYAKTSSTSIHAAMMRNSSANRSPVFGLSPLHAGVAGQFERLGRSAGCPFPAVPSGRRLTCRTESLRAVCGRIDMRGSLRSPRTRARRRPLNLSRNHVTPVISDLRDTNGE